MNRIGLGYDVHAFAEGRRLVLGGVEIPHDKRDLTGIRMRMCSCTPSWMRSSGRCAPVISAKLFPDTDPAYKDADSVKLLEHVGALAREQGYSIEDIDSVVMLQEPKISPYREQMRANIAAALRIPVDNVGVRGHDDRALGL